MELPTVERLRELLVLDENTGNLIWKPKTGDRGITKAWNEKFAGKVAGRINSRGYVQVCIDYHMLYAHRVVWTMVYGEWPPEGMEIDHINGIKHDNRPKNLRLATRRQNCYNMRRPNKTGYKGVKYNAETKKYTAEIRVGETGERLNLGYYDTPEEAYAAYCGAAIVAHREFACFQTLVKEHAG